MRVCDYDYVACISAAAINDLAYVTNSQLVTYMLVPTAVGGLPVGPVVYLHMEMTACPHDGTVSVPACS